MKCLKDWRFYLLSKLYTWRYSKLIDTAVVLHCPQCDLHIFRDESEEWMLPLCGGTDVPCWPCYAGLDEQGDTNV